MKLLSCIAIVILFASCTSTNSIRNGIVNEKNALQVLSGKLDSIDSKRLAKKNIGELDDLTDSITGKYIAQLKDSINNRLTYFNALTSNKKIRRQKKKANAYLKQAMQLYSNELDNILFLDDLFSASTFNKLNTATFFGSGEYKLNDSAAAQVSLISKNLIKEASDFSAAHANKKLTAMFIVYGYADEQTISNGSELYLDLAGAITSSGPDNKLLNAELSKRRALSIKNILKENFEIKKQQSPASSFSANFFAIGKGELLPSANISNYQPVDERRRVVLLYWSILPEFN
ncbi:MAG: OmpA family protein [Ferruginibacter sp.]|nr:OmpA family protein [Ferruginibacter sp.]